ncbi:probable WRKY transcription factor 70 [Prosopis cineraria]|uniref:probable WRKY transcription factor 70 n=1 Tax=Prosopis cineraria TaxID=364024 RepID=UPI00241007CF|nr:probable WRKY transcription factor 70 [Prosopis cineraria]
MATVSPEMKMKKEKIDVIGELVQGYQSASQLKFLLQKPFQADASLSAHQHLAIVLRSFTHSLSLLTSSSSDELHVAQDLVVSGGNDPPPPPDYCLDGKSPDARESRGRSGPATKSRRGCYKRRRAAQAWTVVSSSADDNYAWRKYGQKEILNFKFPRSYLRCTRKYVQGCRAVKQVQRIQENPDMYQITYIGYHTCKDIPKTPLVVTESGNWGSSFLADSEIPNEEAKVIDPIKQEHPKEETQTSDFTDSCLDPSLWSDLKDLSEAAIVGPLGSDDNADTVYSCSGGSLDFGVDDSVHFGSDYFPFDDPDDDEL